MNHVVLSFVKSKFGGLSKRTKTLVLWGILAFATVALGLIAATGYAVWSVGSYVVAQAQKVNTQSTVDGVIGSIEKIQKSIPWQACGAAISKVLSVEFLLSSPVSDWWQTMSGACWNFETSKQKNCVGADCVEPNDLAPGVTKL